MYSSSTILDTSYCSVVELSVKFDYGDSELTFVLNPVDDHYFSTIAEAKSYCRDLIRAERMKPPRMK